MRIRIPQRCCSPLKHLDVLAASGLSDGLHAVTSCTPLVGRLGGEL